MTTLASIKSPVWCYSLSGGGAVVEGLAAIRQCLDIIIRTTKGTDPTRPEFGSDVSKFIDAPVDRAIPGIKLAILKAVSLWEKRVIITRIKHRYEAGELHFEVLYRLVGDSLSDALLVSLSNGGIVVGGERGRLILQGFFPANPSGFQFQVSCSLDGVNLVPMPPANGFFETYDLFLWVRDNWRNYGKWYLNNDGIIGYVLPGYGVGSLSVSLLSRNRFAGAIPALPIGYRYTAAITVDGVSQLSVEAMFTAEQIRQWAESNFADVGSWQVVTVDGSFSADFNDDFDVFVNHLVVYSATAKVVVIVINTEAL